MSSMWGRVRKQHVGPVGVYEWALRSGASTHGCTVAYLYGKQDKIARIYGWCSRVPEWGVK